MKDLVAADFPLTIAAYFGSEPHQNQPQELSFDTVEGYEAYLQGQREADGWMDATFVEHAGYYANKDGEILERKGSHAPPSPLERYVIWGEEPEPGTRAQAYALATPEAAEQFQSGAQDMAGWTTCFLVPSTEFVAFQGLARALESPSLSPEGIAALHAYCHHIAGQAPADMDEELVFVRLSDGAFVDSGWDPRQPVQNAPLTQDQWVQRFDAALLSGYGITANDAGLDAVDLERLAAGPVARFPEHAARDFAKKHDLTPAPRPGQACFGL